MLDTIRTVAGATRAALANPRDTSQVFKIARALSFDTPRRVTRRVRAHANGARLLAERRDILDVLTDRAALEAMPDGSLGRAYLAFLDAEGITAAGLVAASEQGAGAFYDGTFDPETEFVARRLRDTHDLWHAVTGYKGDLAGEASLLAFTFAQIGHPGVGFLALLGLTMARGTAYRRMIADGFARGRRAAFLPAQDWVELLPLPLPEVRRRLRVEPQGPYEEVRDY